MQKQKNEWMRQYFGVHDGKCKNCPHLIKKEYRNRKYYKCLAYGESCSEASDWRISWDACGLIEIPILPENHAPVGQSIRHINRKKNQLVSSNQMSMWHNQGEEGSLDG